MFNKPPKPGEYGYDMNHPNYQSHVMLRNQLEQDIRDGKITEEQAIRFRLNMDQYTDWKKTPFEELDHYGL